MVYLPAMRRSDDHGRRERRIAAGLIVAVHLVLLSLFLRQRASRVPVPVVAVMTVRAIAAPRPVPAPAAIIPPVAPAPVAVPIPVASLAPPTPPAPTCDVLADLDAALANDAAATAAVTAGSDRAVMLWDGAWSRLPAAQPLRRTAVAVLGAVAPACLDEDVVGPRLVFVTVAGTTTTVALGSGTWRWRQLLSFDHSVNETVDRVP